jgi:hypothetical protein
MALTRAGSTVLALALGVVFAAVTIAITWGEHATFNSTSLDLAMYTQLVWNSGQGDPFETTLLLQNRLHLAEHVALLVLPLAPLYALVPEVRLLLLLQQVALAVSGLAVYWLARRRLGGGWALLLLAGYYAMPTLTEVALDAFYPIAFAAVPVGAGVAAALAGWRRSGVMLTLLGMLIEEEAALLGIGLGLYLLLFSPSARRGGVVLLLTSVFWLSLLEGALMPLYHEPTTGAETRAEGHFEQLRTNPLDWLTFVAASRLEPELTRAAGVSRAANRPINCAQPGQCSALRWWLYPTGGSALLSPQTLVIAGPPAAALLLADRPGRFRRHWAAPMLPVIWLAAAAGLSRLKQRRGLLWAVGLLLAAASLVTYRLDGSLPGGSQYEAEDVVLTALGRDLQRLGSQIPPGASVAASRRGLAHLANRPRLYVYPPEPYAESLWPPADWPDYLLLDLRNDDTARAFQAARGPLGASARYQEVERTPNAALLRRAQ